MLLSLLFYTTWILQNWDRSSQICGWLILNIRTGTVNRFNWSIEKIRLKRTNHSFEKHS